MSTENNQLPTMPLTEHLRELRTRLIRSIIAFLIAAGGSFYFARYVFEFLKEPVVKSYPDVELITLSPTEPLFILIKISLTVGLIIASPVILFEIWRFVEPALYPQEKKLFIPLLLSSVLLFVMGGVFAYAVVLPMALKFLLGLGFSQLAATPYLSVNLYVSFVLKMLIAFGIAFEMPIFLYMLQRAGVVSQQQLKKFRRYFIVVAFLVGALIAPDVATQVLMAIPLLVLYEVSILLGRTVRKGEKEKALARVEEEETRE
ncbi:twin-arginine translocase subunit TatC [Hydrogenivirga sp. 128-5-R1-1]|uniref:twin-arginine translocase subunit TatC n=1 Tax=Hydrogenivirga sp. 128-5-R1-1 TaxID=392423 RepID=UPI001E311EA1|nr:twin-arginine translocase subunit TatC [Hydrogenivirga sp. 128-5-R1-1]